MEKVLKRLFLTCVPIARSQNERKSSRDSGVVRECHLERIRFFLNAEIFAISSKGKLIKPHEENMRLK